MNTQHDGALVKNPPFPRNYADTFLHIESGQGVYLKDSEGKTYLDFGSGISVNALGYGRKIWRKSQPTR